MQKGWAEEHRQEQEEVGKNTKTPFSGGLPHSKRQRAVQVPQASEGKALLKTRPHQTSILRAKGKYPEVGEGDGGESSMPVHRSPIRTAGPLQVISIVFKRAEINKCKNCNHLLLALPITLHLSSQMSPSRRVRLFSSP